MPGIATPDAHGVHDDGLSFPGDTRHAVTEGARIRGWCPTAWRPMAAGDGLLVRVRPHLGRLSRDRALALCAVSAVHGSGQLDLTNRAAVQIRGVGEDWAPAVAALIAAELVNADPLREASPALLIAPDWREGDDTHRIAAALLADPHLLPPLPGKIGVAVDAGAAAVLGDAPADFRVERAATGGLILRADGRATGAAITADEAPARLRALAEWFVASGGVASGRMARHHAALPAWADDGIAPARSPASLRPGPHPLGTAVGVPFGRIAADALARLVSRRGVRGVRLTPWRILIAEGDVPDLDEDGDAALLAVDACVGAPACPQATVETRALAERLAPLVAGTLHVSGCAKGCARARAAATVLTGRDGRFDLAHDARAGGEPVAAGLSPEQLLARFESR